MALQRIYHTGAAPATGLSSSITAATTSFGIVSGTGYPSTGPFVIVLDPGTASEEKVLCASLSSNTITVAASGRGWDNTVAASHNAGTTNVQHVYTAAEADDDSDHVYNTGRNDHAQYIKGGNQLSTTLASTVTLTAGTLTNVLTLSGLSATKTYLVYGQAYCNAGAQSDVSIYITTVNAPSTGGVLTSAEVMLGTPAFVATASCSAIATPGVTTIYLLAEAATNNAFANALAPNGAITNLYAVPMS